MNNKWNKRFCQMAMFALPMVFAAALSAQTSVSSDSLQVVEGSRSHAISLNRAGQVEGRILTGQAAGEMNVYFVRDGQVVQSTRTADNGYFALDNVAEGNYSFVATGENGFVAYGVQVQPYDHSSTINALEAAAISTQFSGLKQLLRDTMPNQIASDISSIENGNSGDSFTGSNVVALVDGRLTGRVGTFTADRQPVDETEIYIVQNDREVGRVQADRNGQFIVDGLSPGVYDFIAAGSNGVAAIRFQAVSRNSVFENADRSSSYLPISYRKPMASAAAQSLDVCLTCPGDTEIVGEQFDYSADDAVVMDTVPYDAAPIEYASETLGYSSAAGGSFGGAGNFSGLGSGGALSGGGSVGAGGAGFGRLLSIGALAGGIIGIADGDNTTSAPNPVSPSQN